MNGGQAVLNGITDAQLEALLDVKKNNEGVFQLANVQLLGQYGPPPAPPHPPYGPGSPWGISWSMVRPRIAARYAAPWVPAGAAVPAAGAASSATEWGAV